MTLVRIGAGAGMQIVADVIAWALFLNLVIAQISEKAMAANQFMFRYMVVSFMPAVGISQAVTALVGRYIGMKQFETARQRGDLGFVVAAAYMLICGVLMAAFRYPLIHVFTDDPEVVRLGVILLIFAGVYQFFDAMYIVYNGALRGAGDTIVPGFVTIGLCWGITVFGGYMIAHHFPQWGVTGPWIACTLYGITLGIFMVFRFRRGKWQTIHLENAPASNVANDSAKLSVAAE
jgi:MATE family multidrug resistance protein